MGSIHNTLVLTVDADDRAFLQEVLEEEYQNNPRLTVNKLAARCIKYFVKFPNNLHKLCRMRDSEFDKIKTEEDPETAKLRRMIRSIINEEMERM